MMRQGAVKKSMKLQTGTILNWNEEKGFGFIAPTSGEKTIFAHINDCSRRHKHPFKGLEVQYAVSADQQGRKCAVKVCPLNGSKRSRPEEKQKIFSVILCCGFASVLLILLHSTSILLEMASLYAVMSVVAFILYATDKNAAQQGEWRTSENTLHTVSLLGGWPGAAIAQSFLRHKSKKISFRVTYWITVVANCSALYWLITPSGRLRLQNAIDEILIFIKHLNMG
jgi:uncharacterized membrane protein YsdA (DUF1294 family)/cold shock CspA family protein